ncbi:hypothetical protein HDU98_002177 [Podochytrium sp. JEL0797]|nr:hypothetical protein HDU98_002177 [Podochytrium sp. JEL0797]
MERRDRYAPMDVDDNSSFAGWNMPKSVVTKSAFAATPLTSSSLPTMHQAPQPQLTQQRNPHVPSRSATEGPGLRKRKQPMPDEPLPEASSKTVAKVHQQRPVESVNDSIVESKKGFMSWLWSSPSSKAASEPSNNNSRSTNQQQTQHAQFNGFSNHLLWPYIVMGYLRLAFTLFTMVLSVYLIIQFIRTVQHDLEMKAVEFSSEIIQQVHDCSKMYLANKCSPPEHRVPAMQQLCSDWELCMNRDPYEVGRLKVGAEAIAEVLNRLFEPLSMKTMVFGSVLFFGTLYLYFTAPTFQNLKTLPPHLQHLDPQNHANQQQQQHSSLSSNNGNGAGSFMATPHGMPQFGVPAGAAQMHHHYYGVGAIHGQHVVDRELRRNTERISAGRGGGGNVSGRGSTRLGGLSLEDNEEDEDY